MKEFRSIFKQDFADYIETNQGTISNDTLRNTRSVLLTLTIEEAARYYHIGEGKLRTLIDTHPNEDFYVMNGNRALIKREKFERYLDQATAV